jgi:hypothetical protein
LRREITADLVERLDGLREGVVSARAARRQWRIRRCAYLVSHDGFFYGCEVLERGEQDMAPLRTADVVDKAAKLLAQGNKDLILVFDGLCSRGVLAMGEPARGGVVGGDSRRGRLTVKEGDQLLAGALGAQRQGNGREPVDGIEAEQDVVVLVTRD